MIIKSAKIFFQIHRLQGLGLGHIFLGATIQPITCVQSSAQVSQSSRNSLKKKKGLKSLSKLNLEEEEETGLDSLQERRYKKTKCPMSRDPPLCLRVQPLNPTRGWSPSVIPYPISCQQGFPWWSLLLAYALQHKSQS